MFQIGGYFFGDRPIKIALCKKIENKKLVALPLNTLFWLMEMIFLAHQFFLSWCLLWQIYPSTPSS
jgi:hypothetical protein